MTGNILREWIELVRARRELVRLERSTFARYQFKQGFYTGYHKGRADERVGAINVLEPDPDPPHRQVEVNGIEVDEGIKGLLVALWASGIETQFSCQGEPGKFAPNEEYSRMYAAQIVFAHLDGAVEFMTRTADILGQRNFTEGGLTLATMAPVDDEGPRAEVRFSPALLPELAARWSALETCRRP